MKYMAKIFVYSVLAGICVLLAAPMHDLFMSVIDMATRVDFSVLDVLGYGCMIFGCILYIILILIVLVNTIRDAISLIIYTTSMLYGKPKYYGPTMYDLYKTIKGNENATLEDFFTEIAANSVYLTWVGLEGNDGKSPQEFIDDIRGTNGASVYDIYRSIQGNENKSKEEFIEYMRCKLNE